MDDFENFLEDMDGMTSDFENQHCVIIHFIYLKEELDELHDLDNKLDTVIKEKGVGRYDWHEINLDMTDGTLYMYGPNAEELFEAVRPTLEQTAFTKGAWAVLRFGGARSDVKQIEIQIGAMGLTNLQSPDDTNLELLQ